MGMDKQTSANNALLKTMRRPYKTFTLHTNSSISFLNKSESTLRVNHFSSKKVMYNKYYSM
jgi:hypothetical protein